MAARRPGFNVALYDQSGGGGGGGVDPATILTAGYWRPAMANVFQNTAGTTAVTADGQSVAYLKDSTANGRNLLQATGANQPTYNTATAKEWLTFNGTSGFIAASGWTNFFPTSFAIAFQLNTATQFHRIFGPGATGSGANLVLFVSSVSGGTYKVSLSNGGVGTESPSLNTGSGYVAIGTSNGGGAGTYSLSIYNSAGTLVGTAVSGTAIGGGTQADGFSIAAAATDTAGANNSAMRCYAAGLLAGTFTGQNYTDLAASLCPLVA